MLEEVQIREMCYKCFWPKKHCFCDKIHQKDIKTKFVFLMHPKEFKHEKAGTGRLTCLSLKNAEIIMGVNFSKNPRVTQLLEDPQFYPVLLYPGPSSINLSNDEFDSKILESKTLLVFILDGTWASAKKMIKVSVNLQKIPRLMFTPTIKSEFKIKQQPHEWCLSTLETVDQLMRVLENKKLDSYPFPDELMNIFQEMQQIQINYASDPNQKGYRHKPYKSSEERAKKPKKQSGRNLFFQD